MYQTGKQTIIYSESTVLEAIIDLIGTKLNLPTQVILIRL
jgi:hypothetical protein